MDKAADFQDEEIETAILRLTTLLEPVMIIVMAIVIGAYSFVNGFAYV